MFASIRRSMLFRRHWLACAALCCVVAIAQTVSAQQYKSLAPKANVNGQSAKQLGTKAKAAFRDAANYQTNQKAIDQYFGQVYFPGMTKYTPEALGGLAKKRDNLFRTIRGTKVSAARKQLTELSNKAMKSISRGNYHPAVRYNAVLILGALDEKLANAAAPPVPLSDATNSLIELLENDEFKKVKVLTSVKLGALVGLERHAHCGLAQEQADKLTQVALKLLEKEEPPADVALEVHHWMKCQLARVLTRLHSKKANPQAQVALTKLINDGNMSLEDRCSVAALLDRIDYKNAEGIDAAATVMALGGLMKEVAIEEGKKAREYEKSKLERPRGSSYGAVVPTYQRARLYWRLLSVSQGGASLREGLPDEGKTKINNLLKPLGPVIKVAVDPNSVDLNVTGTVKKLEGEITAVVDSWAQPGEAAEATDEDFS